MQKYFLALVPPDPILSKSNHIKEMIKQHHHVKYALKSPPHITLKMPFNYNEAKEDYLAHQLSLFLLEQKPFPVHISGIGTFGRRVIFQDILPNESLRNLQENLKIFCKKTLHLVDELSDRNFYPHMTLAFKDLKPGKFDEVLSLCQELQFSAEFSAEKLTLLKREEGRWKILRQLPFQGKV
ncbi:2'-5' RNA ligase family protein [Algoriphagus sp. AK58]|uniref:2'-5' RNA ligase family protein n=1 Tax=Algoriphagus sp. AK58 TaxID=1406877 RepID=UPI002105D203|nr:2'-5' RNA ligase family protein [Algoriphagus sp. AK58]